MTTDRKAREKRHPIQVAARRSGLTPDLLRAWEKRYEVVEPGRSSGGHRLYSDEDVERLRLLRLATLSGRSIGRVAQLDEEELAAMVREDEAALVQARAPARAGSRDASQVYLANALGAVCELDTDRLSATLSRALLDLGATSLMEEVLVPFLRDIGERWYAGELSAAHEHFASAVVRQVLAEITERIERPEKGPVLVVATPAGEAHEFGAMLAAATAASEGWSVAYVGADLPARDIAGASSQAGARAVALSVVYEPQDGAPVKEITRLRRDLADDVTLFVGGAAAPPNRGRLEKVGAVVLTDLAAFARALRDLRAAGPGRP